MCWTRRIGDTGPYYGKVFCSGTSFGAFEQAEELASRDSGGLNCQKWKELALSVDRREASHLSDLVFLRAKDATHVQYIYEGISHRLSIISCQRFSHCHLEY